MFATALLKTAEFATLHNRLLRVAARVFDIITLIRIAFANACPDGQLFRELTVIINTDPP